MTKKEARLESRSKILKAAIEEFGAKGYKQASTNAICERIGISKGIIFYHFGSKEQLFFEAVTLCMNEFYSYMREHFVKGETPLEGIRGCCLVRKHFFTQYSEYLKLFCEVLYSVNGRGNVTALDLKKNYEQHTFEVIDKILEGVELNEKIGREENIWIAVRLITLVDMEMIQRYQQEEKNVELQTNGAHLLSEQMEKYEGYLEALLYGILKTNE